MQPIQKVLIKYTTIITFGSATAIKQYRKHQKPLAFPALPQVWGTFYPESRRCFGNLPAVEKIMGGKRLITRDRWDKFLPPKMV